MIKDFNEFKEHTNNSKSSEIQGINFWLKLKKIQTGEWNDKDNIGFEKWTYENDRKIEENRQKWRWNWKTQ